MTIIRQPDNQRDPLTAEAEGFVKAALDALSAHIAILDENGVIVHVNQAWQGFAEQNGFQAAAHGIGQNYLEVCDRAAPFSEDAAQVAQGIRSVRLRETEEFHTEYPCHSLQERRWFLVRVTRFSWAGQTRLIVAHHNITALKRSQIELQESKRWLEAILDNLVDGVMIFDRYGKIELLNRAGAYIFGYDQSAIIGQNVRQLFVGLDDEATDAELAAFLEQVSNLGDEMQGRRADRREFPMYFAVSEMQMDTRHVYTAIFQDFTERKFLEAEVWEKERLGFALEKERELRDLKNRFISMMSHDLKTPLAAIQLAASMLRNYSERFSAAEKKDAYDTIDQQVDYLTELINDVMQISRADFTGAELNLEVVDLETYCRDILEAVQATRRKGLSFVGTERRIEARLDTKLMRRAITNLLTNAIKYSPENSPVTLELTYGDSRATIRVIDNGMGIPPADLPGLFEPFNRASNVGSIQGTGLGLAIAKQAVDLHGGSISVESSLGQGTSFTIILPANCAS